MNYFIDIALKTFLLANLACILMVAFRWGGRLILCQGIFAAIGAYSAAYLSFSYKLPLLLTIPIAMLIGAIAGWFLSLVTAKLGSATFVLVTFLFSMASMEIIQNWDSVTGGRRGLENVFPAGVTNLPVSSKTAVAILLAIIFAMFFLLVRGLYKTQFSRAIRAMRDDIVGAELDGINTNQLKRSMLTFVGCASALIGAVWSLSLPRVLPEYFDFATFALPVVVACILGWGEQPQHALYGSLIVLLLEEGTQQLPVLPEVKADVPVLLIGIVYIITTLIRRPLTLHKFLSGVRVK